MKSIMSVVKLPTGKTPCTPSSRSGSTSSSGMVPPTRSRTSPARAAVVECLREAGHQPHVGAGQYAHANDVGVFLQRRLRHLVGGDSHAHVDDLNAGVAHGPRDDLDAAVVAVQPHLGEEDFGGCLLVDDWSMRDVLFTRCGICQRNLRFCETPNRRSPSTTSVLPCALAMAWCLAARTVGGWEKTTVASAKPDVLGHVPPRQAGSRR